MNWYLKVVLENYINFSGRARRTEFWMFTLFNVIISIVLSILGHLVGIKSALYYIYALAILLPAIGVSIRRLHDTNRTGKWLLLSLAGAIIAFIPFIGPLISLVSSIILIVFFAQNGTAGSNQYGEDPKQALPAPTPEA